MVVAMMFCSGGGWLLGNAGVHFGWPVMIGIFLICLGVVSIWVE